MLSLAWFCCSLASISHSMSFSRLTKLVTTSIN